MDVEGISEELFNKTSGDDDCIKSLSQPGNKTLVTYSTDDNINFAFQGVGISILTLFGISANVLSVIVLTRPKMKSSLTTLLLGLTISDIFVIGTSFLIFSLSVVLKRIQVFPYYSSHIRPHLLPWLLPIALTAQMSSVYFTVIITLERYIAVCLPLKVRSLCTRSSAMRSFFIIVLVSIIYNIPRWFDFHTVPKLNCANRVIEYREEETSLRKNEIYILYYVNWGYLIVFNLIPFTILVYFNIIIYKVAKKHRSRRNSLSPTMTRETNDNIQLAGMLLGIVITFLVCNMLALVINLMESSGIGIANIGNLIAISNFLIICSSSSNFIFYFAFGADFRRNLKRTLGISTNIDPRKNSTMSTLSANTNIVCASVTRIARANSSIPDQRHSSVNILSPNDDNNNGNRTIQSVNARNETSNINEYYVHDDATSNFGGSQLTVQTII